MRGVSPLKSGGFTLTELLVVISIIAIVISLGIGTWRSVVGHSSVEMASNEVGAFIGRVREDSRALKQTRGIVFYLDSDQRVSLAYVANDDPGGRPSQLEYIAGSELRALRPGVLGAFANTGTPKYGLPGVILFDGDGQLLIRDYSIRANGVLGQRMGLTTDVTGYSHLGVTLYERAKGDAVPVAQRDSWLESNGRPLFVNRYNGTLLDGSR